jgi:hypothetical protein
MHNLICPLKFRNKIPRSCDLHAGCVVSGDIMDSAEEDLIRPIYKNGRYQNPFDTWSETAGIGNLFKLMLREQDYSKIPNQRVCKL